MEKGLLLREAIRQAITLAIFYFLMKYFWGDEKWFQDKTKELLFFAGIAILNLVVYLFLYIFTIPITIKISQINKEYSKENTNFSISGRVKTQEHERTIDLTLTVQRRKSIWGWFMLKIIKRKNLKVLIEPVTPGIVLVADKEFLRNDLSSTSTGFSIDIANYLERIILNSNQSSFSKGCEYLVTEDPRNIVSNEIIQVNPILITGSNNNAAPYWINALVRFNKNNGHTIHFKWE